MRIQPDAIFGLRPSLRERRAGGDVRQENRSLPLARRRKMAETRDTFDAAQLSRQKFVVEYSAVHERESIKLVIQLGDVGKIKADGFVAVKGEFSTNDKTTNKKRKWTLRELLAEHAPEIAARLKLGQPHPDRPNEKIDGDSFAVKGPAVVEIEIPVKAFSLENKGSVTCKGECSLVGGGGIVSVHLGEKSNTDRGTYPTRPLIAATHPLAKECLESAGSFCRLFPSRFYYVDDPRGLSAGFHLIEGFFRDDQPLCRSVLSDAEKRELDRLWSELYFVTGIWEKGLRGFVFFERSERNFLKHADFDTFKEEDPELVKDETLARFQEVYLKRAGVKLTGDELAAHPISLYFTDVRAGLRWQAETLKQNEPIYLQHLLAFAERAYRRPLTEVERAKISRQYHLTCLDPEHGIETAVRATIVRILVSPHFCMRLEVSPPGDTIAPLADLDLASRLSYLIWSGPPDAELLALAKAGKLRDTNVLRDQTRRMLRDDKLRRFSGEFFGQWLGYRDFPAQESVNRQVFPTFDDALEQAMFEEPTRLATYLIQQDKPITDLLHGDETLVNKRLADHYGVPFNGAANSDWIIASGMKSQNRGGLLGMACLLYTSPSPRD